MPAKASLVPCTTTSSAESPSAVLAVARTGVAVVTRGFYRGRGRAGARGAPTTGPGGLRPSGPARERTLTPRTPR